MSVAKPMPIHVLPTVFSCGFRPFFLVAGIWSFAALAIWIATLTGHLILPTRFGPLAWHVHEMLFGFVMAAIAGFLLTAIPSWTGRVPVQGARLGILLILWLAGRAACLYSSLVQPWLTMLADLSFPCALAATIAYEILRARNWRNVPVIGPVVVLGFANLLMHLEAGGVWSIAGLGWRLGLGAIIVLISVIGGRIVPAFTRNWLSAHRHGALPASKRWVDMVALGTLHAGIFGWACFPSSLLPGPLLMLAAAAGIARLWCWRGSFVAAEPLLLILHIGYAWLVLGAALLGLSVLTAVVPADAAIHAFTAGAIGTMVLAVMTRATRGHTGRALTADRNTRCLFLLVTISALTRVAAAFWHNHAQLLFICSGSLWLGAFGSYVLIYGPMLLRPGLDTA